ncbi:MAG: hypothetical protein MR503_09595 [Oscillospiraceae bacterium]|nr:hypothetical protein [Oscillospiraceae bacterium]
MFKKIISIAVCAVFTGAMLCGCGDKEESSQDYFYGQALKEVDGGEIYLIYDGRFVEDEEMEALVNYYVSIQSKDYELFESVQPEAYLDFLKDKQSMDIEGYVDDEYSQLETDLGAGFDFSQIEVTDCGDSKDDNGINDIKDLLDGIYKDAGKEKSFSDTIKSAKYVTFDLTAIGGDGDDYNLTDEMKYIFNCEDGIYIF